MRQVIVIEMAASTGRVWVRIDRAMTGRIVTAHDWDRDVCQASIDEAVEHVRRILWAIW